MHVVGFPVFRSHLGNTRKDAGDAKVFSSALERTLLELGSFKFKRGLFYGNKVVSRMRIAQVLKSVRKWRQNTFLSLFAAPSNEAL